MSIIIKTSEEVAAIRQAGTIVAAILEMLSRRVKTGMETRELDIIAARELKRRGAKASFKGYRGFPASLCVSINDEIVHGIPGKRVLRDGDIASLDFGAIFMGFQADAAMTVGVGKINSAAKQLIETTKGALREMHEEPQIPNYGLAGSGPVLKKGMTLALEPMVNADDWRTRTGDDHWTVLTADGSLSAHFEHTIAITDGEPEVLTRGVYA
jgi:methionyl aminopeptidase